MNRIKLGPLATMSPIASAEIESGSRTARPRNSPNDHSIFIPLHYEKNYAYPLIVWLHDQGFEPSELADVMAQLSLRNYIAVAVRGSEPAMVGGFDWRQEASSIEQSDRAIADAIDDARRQFNVATRRIFIAGCGSGGTMAFRIGFLRPDWFGGILSFNGSLPVGAAPLARLNECRRLPIFWTQCRHDERFSESQLAVQLRVLHVGGFNVTLRQYPGGDQRQQILADANRWLMELITRPAGVAP
jgi:phospholipase/carboxylesterase